MVNERINRIVGFFFLFVVVSGAVSVLALGEKPILPTIQFHVEFDRAGQLRVGAPFKIVNMEVGGVLAIRHIGPDEIKTPGVKPAVGRVRVTVWLKYRYRKYVWINSRFIVTSAGLMGARHLEALPPLENPGRLIRSGDTVLGESPALLDRMLQMTYDSLNTTKELMDSTRPVMLILQLKLRRVLDLAEELGENKKLLRSIGDRSSIAGKDIERLVDDLRAATRDGKRIDRLRVQWEELARRLKAEVERLKVKAKDLELAIDGLQDRVKQLDIKGKTRKTETIWKRIRVTTDRITAHLKRIQRAVDKAEGTIGAFLKERELFDDFKATQKKLVHTPWSPLARPKKASTKGYPVP